MIEPISTTLTIAIVRASANKIVNESAEKIKKEFNKLWSKHNFSTNNEDLITSIENISLVKTLFTGAQSSVDLNSFFLLPKLTIKQKIKQVSNINQINTTQNILIEATVGQGKSIFMRYLALQELHVNKKIPIFIELKSISKEKSLDYLIFEKINNWIDNLNEEQFRYILRGGNVSIFLDAFDEISKDFINNTLSTIEKLSDTFPKLKIIVSSRPDTAIKHSTHFEVINVNSYDNEDRQNLIKKIVTEKTAQEQLIKSIQSTTPEVKEVLTTPLMIGLYIRKYTSDFTPPERIIDFYKNIFDLVSITHDKSKGWDRESESKLNRDELELVFERFCFEMFLEDKLLFGQDIFIEKIRKSLTKYELNASPHLVMADFTKYLCLILQDGTEFTFIHRSIHEFYLAKFISKLEIENAKKNFIKKIFPSSSDNLTFFISHLNKYFYYKLFLLPIFSYVKENTSFSFSYTIEQDIPDQILNYCICTKHDFNEFFISDTGLIESYLRPVLLKDDKHQQHKMLYFLNEYLFKTIFNKNTNYRFDHSSKEKNINNKKFTRELHKHMKNNREFRKNLEDLTIIYNDIINYIAIKENEVTDEDLSDI